MFTEFLCPSGDLYAKLARRHPLPLPRDEIAMSRVAEPSPRSPGVSPKAYLGALLAALLGTLLALGISRWLALPNISLVFLLVVLLVAIRSSAGPALFCALLSFVAYGFCFLPPHWSVVVHREQDLLTLLFFLLMALLTGNLAARQRRQFRDLQQAQRQTQSLLEFTGRLSSAQDQRDLLEAMRRQLALPGERLCLLSRTPEGHWLHADGNPCLLSELERISAEHAWCNGQPRGYDSHSLEHPHWWWWPLLDARQPLALLGLRTAEGDAPLTAQRHLIGVLLPLLAHALSRVQLVEALGRSRLQHETERLRSALLTSVSHDLRTPLTAMRGNIETLQLLSDSLEPAIRDDLLSSTAREASRLDRYIQNLLDMTRLSHGGLRLECDWVAAEDLLATALRRLQPVLQGVRVTLEMAAETPLLWVQGVLIEQALINVLDNAARFSPADGTISIRVSHGQDGLCFVISDQGPGIPVEQQAHIFELFYTRARGDSGAQGSGLGLAICRGMLEAHGGTVRVESRVGQGTSLFLQLPIKQVQERTRED
jgi:K+-sensing histidine kinase KdpD